MSEKDKLSFNEGEEEEFHITDEDIDRELAAMETDHAAQDADPSAVDAAIDQPVAKNRFAVLKKLKRKHWLMIAVIVLLLLFAWVKIIGSREADASFGQITPVSVASNTTEVDAKKATLDLNKNALEPQASKAATSAALLPTPTLSAPASAMAKTDVTAAMSNDAQLTQALQTIQQQNQLLTQQLTALSNRVVGLESNLQQSSQAVEGLSQKVGTLNKADTPARPLPRLAQSAVTAPQYSVEAVVPQRAWLQAPDGSTITVMIGDDIPELGAVVSIDPYSGNVATASGTVIKYGS